MLRQEKDGIMKRDQITGIVAVVIAAFFAVLTFQLEGSRISNDVGPKVFPFIAEAVIAICGAGLICFPQSENKRHYSKAQVKRFALIIGVMLLFVVGLNWLGYFIPMALACFAISYMFGKEQNVPWWKCLIFSIIVTFAVFFLFEKGMQLKVPKAKIPFFKWW